MNKELGRLSRWLDAERVELITGRLKQMEQELINMMARAKDSGNLAAFKYLDEMTGAITKAVIYGDKLTKEKQI